MKKTTLKKTIELSEKGVITNPKDIREITDEMLSVSFEELQQKTSFFSFVLKDYEDDMDNFFADEFLMSDIIRIPQRLCINEDKMQRREYIQNIMLGIIRSDCIFQIKMFTCLSLKSFMKIYAPSRYRELCKMSSMYLCYNIDEKTSIGDFLKVVIDIMSAPWHLSTTIEYYRERIETAIDIVDMVLLDSMVVHDFNDYPF